MKYIICAVGLLLGGVLSEAHAQVGAGLRSSPAPQQGVDPSMPLTSVGQPAALYVDGALGNDAGGCASSGAGACKTIQAAVNKLPAFLGTSDTAVTPQITISVAAGTYTETVRVAGIGVRNRSGFLGVNIAGTRTVVANNGGSNYTVGSLTANDVDTGADNGTRRLTISPSPGWTTDAYKGKWVEGITGTSAGSLFVVVSNGADTIDYIPTARSSSTFSVGATVRITEPGTTIAGQVFAMHSSVVMQVSDTIISSGSSAPWATRGYGAGLWLTRCKTVSTTTGSSSLYHYANVTFTGSVIAHGIRPTRIQEFSIAGTYFDLRGGGTARFDNIGYLLFQAAVYEGPSSALLTLEGSQFNGFPKLLNRSGAAPGVLIQNNSSYTSTGGTNVAFVSIGSAASSNTAFSVANSYVNVRGGIYVTNATVAVYAGTGATIDSDLPIPITLSGVTTFFTGASGASLSLVGATTSGTVTNGYILSGAARVLHSGTAPAVTSTNNVSVDGGASYVTYANTPVVHISGTSYGDATTAPTLTSPLGVSPLDRNPQVSAYYNCNSPTLQTVGAASTVSYVSTFGGVDFGACSAGVTTGTTINGSAGWTTTPATGVATSPQRVQVGMYLPAASANERVWPAFIGTVKNPETFDSNSSARYCGIRYSTAASDTQWKCCSSNGTTASCEDFTARAAGIYVFIARMSTTSCTCSLANWQTGAITANYTKTTHAPGGGGVTTYVYPSWGIRTLANSNDIVLNFGWATAFNR